GSARLVPHAHARSPLSESLRLRGARRVSPALFLGHLADDQRATLDLLADEVQFLLTLLLSPVTRRGHRSPRSKGTPTHLERRRCPRAAALRSATRRWCVDIGTPSWPARLGCRREIRASAGEPHRRRS